MFTNISNFIKILTFGIAFLIFCGFILTFIYFYKFPEYPLNARGIALLYNTDLNPSKARYKNIRTNQVFYSPFKVKYRVYLPYGLVYEDHFDNNIHVSIYPISLFKHFAMVLPLEKTLKLLGLLDIINVNKNEVSLEEKNDVTLQIRVYNDETFKLWGGRINVERDCDFLLWWRCKDRIQVGSVHGNIYDSSIHDYASILRDVRLCTTRKNILTAIAIGPGITSRYVIAPWERPLYTDSFNKIVQDASKASMSIIKTSKIDSYFWGRYLAVLDDPIYILNDNMPYFYILNLADK